MFGRSLTFGENKILVPWVKVYDATTSQSLRKLIVTFEHDEFDILRVVTSSICECLRPHHGVVPNVDANHYL